MASTKLHTAPLNQKWKSTWFQSANPRICHAMLIIQEQQKVTRAITNIGAQEQPSTSPDLRLHVRVPPGGWDDTTCRHRLHIHLSLSPWGTYATCKHTRIRKTEENTCVLSPEVSHVHNYELHPNQMRDRPFPLLWYALLDKHAANTIKQRRRETLCMKKGNQLVVNNDWAHTHNIWFKPYKKDHSVLSCQRRWNAACVQNNKSGDISCLCARPMTNVPLPALIIKTPANLHNGGK